MDDDALRLQFDSLKVISELILDVSHLRDAAGDLWVHWTGNLQHHVNSLRVEVKGFLKLTISLVVLGFLDKGSHVSVGYEQGL